MTDPRDGPAQTDIVQDLLERFFNRHDPSTAKEFFTEDFTFNAGSLGTIQGREAYATALTGFWRGLPDARATVHDLREDGDTVTARLTVTATHSGPLWQLPATGRQVTWPALMIYQFRGDRVATQWAAEDWVAILAAVGDYTPPWLR